MAQLKFVLEGGPELTRAMRATLINAQDLRGVWDAVDADFRELQSEQFARGGPPTGRKWPRNSPAWSRAKGNKPVGVYTGRLRESLTRERSQGRVSRRGPAALTTGTSLRYANAFSGRRPLLRVVNVQVQRRWADIMAGEIALPLLEGERVRAVRTRRRRRRRRPVG